MQQKGEKGDALHRTFQERLKSRRLAVQELGQLFEMAESDADLKTIHADVAKEEKQNQSFAREVIGALAEVAEYTPPREYRAGKHAKGRTEDDRAKNSANDGPGQYHAGLSDQQYADIEKKTLQEGHMVDKGGTIHAYHEHDTTTGYADGEATKWHRAEMTGIGAGIPVVHGHPRSETDAKKQIKNSKKQKG